MYWYRQKITRGANLPTILCLLPTLESATMPAPTRRPNILFITSDQQRGDCYGFAGRKVRTPHLDQLAADGTHFSACITPNLVCQPSRPGPVLVERLPIVGMA